MSAQKHLQPAQFFHGTAHDFKPGEMVGPRQAAGADRPYTYLTDDQGIASGFATMRGTQQEKPARVFEVQPSGKVTRDFQTPGSAFKSRYGLKVVREVENPARTPRYEMEPGQ